MLKLGPLVQHCPFVDIALITKFCAQAKAMPRTQTPICLVAILVRSSYVEVRGGASDHSLV